MCFKLFGFGIKGYLSDSYNCFDAIIVFISLAEISIDSDFNGIQVFRALRLTRVFRIIKSWPKLRILVETVIKSLSAVGNLGMLTFIFVFIMALLAKSVFANPPPDSPHADSRYNFQSTGNSIVTTFIVLSGENWN
jgi:hypothetical protein